MKKRPHKCLKYRGCTQRVVKILLWIVFASILTINIHKYSDICPEKTPYMICVANYKCAYIHKSTNMSLIDHLAFLSDNNLCVKREFLPHGLSSLTKSSTLFVNNLFKSVFKSDKKLLADFSYDYDNVVFWEITRQEVGYWLAFVILVWMNKSLKTMGNKKSLFDVMEPSYKNP